ncbi:hypothetical protein PTTG_25119 [Puccinia triticina 1-1 BBBD Race 1]|uniref:Ecp2 effector protein domain-containing protein n=2 Tax=Puccinia triticina TaxID=208348 RepID=A0A180H5L6_PUCT1|nr:uncharacterized protein PtA15_9A286 [Puccinia triticina]OAV99958.1 hypothetical protein PTTG_25119 [Puccinia triticina 1-1 BBBD Race 1]WAQ88161.1 hypothetical protein PtA15_9A286 [Puccinia triticina]WAR60349.1 hypothetical protein PtB15_9B288 [Puccinia triticina]
MVAFLSVLFVAAGFLSMSLAVEAAGSDTNSQEIDCFRRTAINRKEDCELAISKIQYQRDNTLDTASKHFGWASGNCSVIVLNPDGATTTKEQIHKGFNQILDQCKPHGGEGNPTSSDGIFLHIGTRSNASYAPYESDFPFLYPTCGINKNAPDIRVEDCKRAYNDITLDGSGVFPSQGNQQAPSVTNTYQSCTVMIYTSDDSTLLATKGNLNDIFGKMLGRCNGKSGVVSVKEGAQGLNGRVYLKIRSSIPCGFGPGKQVCH